MNIDIRSTASRLWRVIRPADTNWQFVTSDGTEVAVGLPIGRLISGGVSGGHFYVKSGRSSVIETLTFGALSVGVGVGTPVSAAHSEFEWPAGGWGNIWRIPFTLTDQPPDTFAGQCLMYSISGSVSPLVSSGLGAYGVTLICLGGNRLAASNPFFLGMYKYVGVIYGSFASTPGVGINAYIGQVIRSGRRR